MDRNKKTCDYVSQTCALRLLVSEEDEGNVVAFPNGGPIFS